MTGAEIVGTLLRGADAVTGKVAVADIKLGLLPDNAALPSLLIRTVSVVDRQPLKRVGWVRRVDRVSVTVRAGSYRDQVAIIGLVRHCLLGLTGDIGGGQNVSIQPAGTGPDLNGPASSFEQAQDLRVSFDEPA